MKYLKKETIRKMASNIPDKDKRISELIEFVNKWGNERNNEKCRDGDKITDFGLGYKQALLDVTDLATKLDLDIIWAADQGLAWILNAEERKLKYWILENMVIKK